ncbi:EAL domain-containing protein [Kangiella marina]|uniref:Uncharacterized protein n=1 Tax=Kangiella marina TaxID=1079178 RepID=A0ABP8IPB9_9GAMM
MDKVNYVSSSQELLFDISRNLLKSENVEQTADIIVKALYSHIKSFDCAFFRFEPSHNQLICISYASREAQGLSSFKLRPIEIGVGVVGHAAEQQETQRITRKEECDYWLEYNESNTSELTVPVVVDGELIGVIDLEDDREGFFSEEAQHCIEEVALLVGKFLEQQILSEHRLFRLEQVDYSEERAKSKDSYFSKVLEQLGDPVFILSPSGKVIDLNQSAVLSLGYAKSELIGHRAQKFEQIINAENSALIYRTIKYNDPLIIEGIHTRKDGSRFFVEIKMACLEDDNIIAVARDISARRTVLKELEDSQKFLQEVIKTSPDVIYAYDFLKGKLMIGRARLSQLLGYDNEDEQFDSFEDFAKLAHPDDVAAIKKHVDDVFKCQEGRLHIVEARLKHVDGDYRWIQSRSLIFQRNPDQSPVSKLGSLRDITEQNRLKSKLARRENYYRALVENAFDGIALYDAEGCVTFCSGSASKLLGYTEEEVLTMHGLDFVHKEDADLAINAWRWLLEHPGEVYRIPDYRLLTKTGESIWVENTFINLLDDRNVAGIISNFRDIGQRKSSEQSLYRISNYDSLTELPNRGFLKKQLRRYISQAKAFQGFLTLIYFDVTQLNLINNAWGHSIGDKVLLYIVEQLQRHTEEFDFIARTGDDEFAVVLNQKDSFEATKLVESIVEKFDSLIRFGDAEVKISIRAGIVRYPEDGNNAEELINKAEITTRHVKSIATQFAFYQETDTRAARDKLLLEKDLVNAIQSDSLELHYQPKVEVASGRIDSLEALLRWNHPHKGPVSPQLAISIAEESNLIYRLTDWVVTQAVKQIAQWREEGLEIKVSINLSVKDLMRNDLQQKVSDTLSRYHVDATLLDLEITESAAMVNTEQSISLLQSVKEMGMSVSLDDFGTGYSSISHLTSLPVDIVKIDQSFIRQFDKRPQDAKHDSRLIIQNIIRLARSFHLTSLVEGVETVEQLELLKEFDCDLAQGYLFSRPVTAETLKPVIEQGYIDLKALKDADS